MPQLTTRSDTPACTRFVVTSAHKQVKTVSVSLTARNISTSENGSRIKLMTCLGGARLETRLAYLIHRCHSLVLFSCSMQILEQCLKLGHGSFLPYPYQFTVQCLPVIWCYIILFINSVVIYKLGFRDFRLPSPCKRDLRSSWMLRNVNCLLPMFRDKLGSIFKGQAVYLELLDPWRWDR
jgi:hypothetical protein